MKIIKFLIIIVATVTFAGCDAWKDERKLEGGDRSMNLYELLSANPDVSTFVKALDATGYAEKLGSDMSYTVFAPSNSAIANLDMADTQALTNWIQNYISEKIVYTNEKGAFSIDSILMLNGKNVPVNGNLISGIPVSKWNIASKNGVLHIIGGAIEDRMNIWEYLQTLKGEPIVDFIASFNEKVMDMERSVQTGVNSEGRPIYDTIWISQNTLLNSLSLANESANATFLLLDRSGLDVLIQKYDKYFAQKDSVQMTHDIIREIISDMILPYTKISADGRYPNNSGVLVDVNTSDISGSYTASNGIVYRVKAANVKMYMNKIKPLVIEGENFVGRWPDAWQTRPREWASGGYDVMLKSRTRHSYDRQVTVYYNDTLKSVAGSDSIVARDSIQIINQNNLYSFNYRSENEWPTANVLGSFNAYIAYNPRMYSTSYKIYWKAYDDNSNLVHIDSLGKPMLFYQKMYISFPGETPLERTSGNVITGNFSSNTIMAAAMSSGENTETQLVRYSVNNAVSSFPSCYILVQPPTTTEDNYGKEGILICPTFGQATLFVSNTSIDSFTHSDGTVQAYLTTSATSNAPGMIFLDYIRLEPQVDPND